MSQERHALIEEQSLHRLNFLLVLFYSFVIKSGGLSPNVIVGIGSYNIFFKS